MMATLEPRIRRSPFPADLLRVCPFKFSIIFLLISIGSGFSIAKDPRRLRKAAAATAQKDISITAGPEEIDEHQWILYRLRSAGYAGLTTQKAAELYLEQYLPWAKEHREELAAFRKKKRKQYLAWNIGVVAGVFGAVFLFWFLVA